MQTETKKILNMARHADTDKNLRICIYNKNDEKSK